MLGELSGRRQTLLALQIVAQDSVPEPQVDLPRERLAIV
jgi:hypothetical protein